MSQTNNTVPLCPPPQQHQSRLIVVGGKASVKQSLWSRLLDDKIRCDVMFTVSCDADNSASGNTCTPTTNIWAHSCILATVSPVFAKMFEGVPVGHEAVFTIQDITPKNFLTILTWIYTQRIVTDSSDLYHVLCAAHKYQLYNMAEALTNDPGLKVCHSCVWKFLSYALKVGDTCLQQRCFFLIDQSPFAALSSCNFLVADNNVVRAVINRHTFPMNRGHLFKFLMKRVPIRLPCV